MEKVLSVSIAAYNVEKFLSQTLDSLVVSEIMDELEVIVVSDGSTDQTAAIAKEYCDRYPNTFVLIDKANGGYGSTINAAVKVARGKYFRLLDGDDWFDSEGLKSFIIQLKDADEDMIITKFKRVFDSDGHEEERDQTVLLAKESGTFDDVNSSEWFTMHGTTFRTAIWKENNIQITEHCFYTDQEYDLLPLRWVKTIRRIPVMLYCYRIGRAEQSVSPQGLEKHYMEEEKVLNKLYEVYSKVDEEKTAKDKYIFNYLSLRTQFHIGIYLIISNTVEHKKQMIDFIEKLKKNRPLIYERVLKNSKSIHVLVSSKYLAYGTLQKYKSSKLRNKNN